MISHYLPDTTLIFVNQAYCRTFGLSESELIGRKFLEHILPDYRKNMMAIISSLTPEQPAITHECQVVLPDGTLCWQEWTDQAIFNDAGEIVEYQAVGRDINERKKTEEALRVSEQELRTITDNMTDVVSMADVEGRFTYLSESIYQQTGYRPSELLGKSILELIHEDDLSTAAAIFQESVVEGRKGAIIEYRVRHKNNDYIWIETIGSLVLDDSGQPSGALFVSRDITDRKQVEEELKRQAAERAAVDTFTYSVSNDLQAPLRRIEGFSEMLLEECPDQLNDQAQGYLNRIITQIDSMKKLTGALLQLSRVVSRKIDREEVDLSALIRSNLEKLRYEEPERQHELVVAPGLITEGDVELLNLMLAKLLDNAWKFSAGEKETRIEFGNTEQNGRTVYFLKDNGVGFDMNHAEKLFAPFQKLHSDEDYPGIGIGLNLVYRIISRHSGEIWAEGEEGKGACIFFTLP